MLIAVMVWLLDVFVVTHGTSFCLASSVVETDVFRMRGVGAAFSALFLCGSNAARV